MILLMLAHPALPMPVLLASKMGECRFCLLLLSEDFARGVLQKNAQHGLLLACTSKGAPSKRK